MSERLVIVGAGGFGREVLDVVDAINALKRSWEFVGFVDDGEPDVRRLLARQAQFLGGVGELKDLDAWYSIGIARGEVRERIDHYLRSIGREAATLLHPHSTVGSANHFNAGCVITAGTRVTTNVSLGRHVHVNINSTIGHDCRIGPYVTVNPGVNISGEVTVGARVMVGTGASILQGLSLGADCVVGAGAVVTKDVPAGVTVVGAPARAIGK